jgi:CDGSH-type Zn-finger protein
MAIRTGDSKDAAVAPAKPAFKVTITQNGPYLVSGSLPLKKEIVVPDGNGDPIAYRDGEEYPDKKQYALCRCGKSGVKPFCDGTHDRVSFNGTEVATTAHYQRQAVAINGPELLLTDAKMLCSAARFCHPDGGTWELTQRSDDPWAKKQAIRQACNCTAGRLVIWDRKTGKAVEPDLDPSISLIEDPQKKVSGPIWLKGGIPLESSRGTTYEIRNRVTLCRCGGSRNIPFCDGTHCENGFDDGDESIRK